MNMLGTHDGQMENMADVETSELMRCFCLWLGVCSLGL